jgi:hypothetical protein
MGELNIQEEWERAVVEDALNHLPESDPPAGMHPAVMRRVRSLPRPGRFRLHWLDLSLMLFSATLLAAGSVSWALIPALERLRLIRQAILIWQWLRLTHADQFLLGLGLMVISGIIIWLSLAMRPRRVVG